MRCIIPGDEFGEPSYLGGGGLLYLIAILLLIALPRILKMVRGSRASQKNMFSGTLKIKPAEVCDIKASYKELSKYPFFNDNYAPYLNMSSPCQ